MCKNLYVMLLVFLVGCSTSNNEEFIAIGDENEFGRLGQEDDILNLFSSDEIQDREIDPNIVLPFENEELELELEVEEVEEVNEAIFLAQQLEEIDDSVTYEVTDINDEPKLKLNSIIDYYGVPIVIFDIKYLFSPDHTEKLFDAIIREDSIDYQDNDTSFDNAGNKNDVLSLLNRRYSKYAVMNYQKTNYSFVHMTEHHRTILVTLIEQLSNAYIEKGTKALIMFYVHDDNPDNINLNQEIHSTDLVRSIYTQELIYYIKKYMPTGSVRIEKRYLDTVAPGEVLLLVFGYDGPLRKNIFNSSKESIAQWVAQYNLISQSIINRTKQLKAEFGSSLENR